METTIRKFETPIGDVLVTKEDEKHYFVKYKDYTEPWGNEVLAIKKAKMLATSINNQVAMSQFLANQNQPLTYFVLVKTIENRRCFYGWAYNFQICVSEPWWRHGISIDLCKKFKTEKEAKQEASEFTDVTIIKITEG